MTLGLGAVRVVTPGIPVDVPPPSNVQSNGKYACHAILFQALTLNSGNIYIGSPGMDKATLAGVMVVLLPPTESSVMSFSTGLPLAPNGLNLDEFVIDADQANDGVLVSLVKL